MSFFTLVYVTPILGLIYYLFFWSRSTRSGASCVSNGRASHSIRRSYQLKLGAPKFKPDLHLTGTSQEMMNLEFFYGLGLTGWVAHKILETPQIRGLLWEPDFGLGLVNFYFAGFTNAKV